MVVDELPVNAMGKLSRPAVAKLIAEAAGE
jgi:acyl-coenzyme A synthetase/AMP-(fatty) acid ligase